MERSRAVLPLALATSLLFACSGGGNADAGTDAGDVDTGTLDAGTDAGHDGGRRVDGGPMPTFDTSTTWGATPLDCPTGPAQRTGRDLGAQRKFALSVLHYNVQYVAGGLDNFLVGGAELFDGWTDDRVQDAIVTQSLAPVLDLLDAHPTWTLSIELQGYMMEVMLARHRTIAQHLADLVRSGQVELVSFHYGDQLFLAYPRHHMEVSRTLDLAAFAAGCVVPSGPVFTQEGQFGEGMADLLGTSGDATLLLPKNLFSYFHGDGAVDLYYTTHGVPVVIAGRGVSDAASGFDTTWVYMNDAELLATGGVNPYVPDQFVVHPDAVAAFESQLTALETSGYVIAGVSDYVATLQGAGVAPTPLPPMLDGTWQPDDTGDLARWMGDAALWPDGERDNLVLTTNTAAGRMALAAETALDAARTAGHEPPGAAEDVTRAWRDLLLGEVSDATGWNPIPNETFYGLAQAGLAETRARGVAITAAAALGVAPPFVVDTATGTVVSAATSPMPALEDDPTPPFDVTPSADRGFTAHWQRVSGEPDHHVLTIDVATSIGRSPAEVVLPWRLSSVRYTPAMLDGTSVEIPLSAITLPMGAGIPVGSGPFGLDDDLWLVLDTTTVDLAARLDATAHTATFRDGTVQGDMTPRWVFHVVTAPLARALSVADALDVHPRVLVTAP